jgi:glycosyltransferase involved in cell wall biosynthesis
VVAGADRARVLHLLSGCTVGGCEQHVLALLQRLDRDRFEPWLACFEAEPDAATPMLPMFHDVGVDTVDLGAGGGSFARRVWRLGTLMARERFDIVHAHSLRTEVAALLWARTRGLAPIVVRTVHNTDDYYVRPGWREVARFSASRLDRVIAISDAVAEFLARHAGVSRSAIRRIHYGIDPTPYSVVPRLADARPTVLMLARLAPQKGHRVLFAALARVRERVPNVRVRLVGHEELSTAAELRAAARSSGVDDLIEFEGFRGDVPALFADCDVKVLPSHWEGFGLVLLEAMASGRPVVASRVGAIPEIMVDGETGFLVAPGDADHLARALVEVLSDRSRAAAMGLAGRHRAEQHFGIEAMVRATESEYDALLRAAGRRAA